MSSLLTEEKPRTQRHDSTGRLAIEAVLFDLGGVLLHYGDAEVPGEDLDALGLAAFCDALREAGHGVEDELLVPPVLRRVERYWHGEFLHRRGRDLGDEVSRRLLELGRSIPLPARRTAWLAFQEAVSAHVHLDGEAAEILDRLHREGYRLGWLSNTVWPLSVHRRDLDGKGLLDFFEVQVCSSECGTAKPDAALFEHAAAALGSSVDRTVFVGDRPFEDIAGAAQLGLVTVLRRAPDAPAQDPPPAHQITTLGELPELLPKIEAGGRRMSLEITCHLPPPEPLQPLIHKAWPDALLPFVEAGRQDPRLRAMAVGGSHASGTADRFSDLDLLVVTAAGSLEEVDAGMPDRLGTLGEALVHGERRDLPAIAHSVHRCLYRDGRRCDVLLTSEERLGAHPFYLTAEILMDKTGRLSEIVQRHATMTFDFSWDPLIERTVTRFCFDAHNAWSAIGRGRTLEAHAALEDLRRGLFVLVHLALPEPRFWPDEPHKGLADAAARLGIRLEETLAGLENDEQNRALVFMVSLLFDLARRWPGDRRGPSGGAQEAMERLLDELHAPQQDLR